MAELTKYTAKFTTPYANTPDFTYEFETTERALRFIADEALYLWETELSNPDRDVVTDHIYYTHEEILGDTPLTLTTEQGTNYYMYLKECYDTDNLYWDCINVPPVKTDRLLEL